jgi:phosphodiesterase/alkaline phosphatase D-like protein
MAPRLDLVYNKCGEYLSIKGETMSELILSPIVGGLADTRAHLWGRANGPGLLHAWLGQQPDLSDAHLEGQSLTLSPQDGFAGVAPLYNLQPNTHYHYALTLADTPPDPAHAPYPEFTTFPPDGTPTSFAFAFGSCFRPSNDDGGQIFNALDARRKLDDLRFAFFIGDQIYADAWQYNSLNKIACTLDEYRAVYAYTWSRPAFRQLIPNLPAFMTLDDHEVDDDWHWVDDERQIAHVPPWDRFERWVKRRPYQERHISRQRAQDALQAYWEHQAMHAPTFVVPPQINAAGQYALTPDDRGSLAYAFNFGTTAFFVMDTRTQRVRNRHEHAILGPAQWEALENWLLQVKDTHPVKFLITSSALLFYMFTDLPADRWPGFPKERARLLNFLAEHEIKGVHLITGDLHSAHAIRAELSGPSGQVIPLWEYCASPFEQRPNWVAPRTYWPLRHKPVIHQEIKFCIDKLNFGVVKVNMADPTTPGVSFELYGENGELLGNV